MKTPIVLLLITFCSTFAHAQNRNIVKLSANSYKVGAFSSVFKYERMNNPGGTDNDSWCWAACIQMTLEYGGLIVSQDQIINFGFAGLTDRTGSPQELMSAINRTAPNNWGRPSHIYSESINLDVDLIFDELSSGRPLIVGLRTSSGDGVANVITSMNYSINYNAAGEQTGITPSSVTLRDPWPSAPSQKIITWNEFINNAGALYYVKIVYN